MKQTLKIVRNPDYAAKRDKKREDKTERKELRELFLHPALFATETRRAA